MFPAVSHLIAMIPKHVPARDTVPVWVGDSGWRPCLPFPEYLTDGRVDLVTVTVVPDTVLQVMYGHAGRGVMLICNLHIY